MTNFSNPILAGTTLVRKNMQSEDFLTGVSGWRISRDGDAEFNDLTARGNIEARTVDVFDSVSGGRVLIDPDRFEGTDIPRVAFVHPDHFSATADGYISHRTDDVTGDTFLQMAPGRTNGETRGRLSIIYDVSFDRTLLTFGQGVNTIARFHGDFEVNNGTFSINEDGETQFALITDAGAFRITDLDTSAILFQVNTDRFDIQGQTLDTNGGGIAASPMRPTQNINTTLETVDSTSFEAEANPASLVFTAPQSGQISITVNAFIDVEVSSGTRTIFVGWEVREGGTIGSGTIVSSPSDTRAAAVGVSTGRITTASERTVILGTLTPGSTYNIQTHSRIGALTNLVRAEVENRGLIVRPEM